MNAELARSLQKSFVDAAHLLRTTYNQIRNPRRQNDFDDRSSKVKFLDTCRALVSEATLAEWLQRQAKVDLSQWGQPGAKTVDDLFTELLRGESQLRSDGCRVVRVAKVRILHGDYELINTLQASPQSAVNTSSWPRCLATASCQRLLRSGPS
jgi:hypothetical protein